VGNCFLRDIPDVLKVTIISDQEDLTNIDMEREKISKEKAISWAEKQVRNFQSAAFRNRKEVGSSRDCKCRLNNRNQKQSEEINMKRITPTLTIFGTMLLASPLTGAVESPESGLTWTPEQMIWEPNPRVAGLGVAPIISNGKMPGYYVYRVKFPPGRVVQAHSHPDDRTYTVISGTWRIGWGEKYDESKLITLGPGSFYTEPAGVPHFVATPDGEAIVQVTGTGPTTIHYIDPAHAPKK
jgi:quercetin dioxygenase-like cupin family protein